MRRICICTLLASAISSSALAQSPQPGYANAAINQPYAGQAALAQQNYVVPQPHYVTPPPHYIVPQTSNVATPSADSALPPAPWNSRGGGLFGAIFGGPTVMAHVFRSFQPNSISAPQNGPPAYAAIDQGGMQDYSVDPKYLRQVVFYNGAERPGTIVIDTPNKFLYLIEDGGKALRYGIGVGRPGFLWSGLKTITAKREWPDWRPPPEMLARRPDLPRFMPGGIDNPLGARALYLGSSLYRIHGSNEPWTIGTNVSSGCIRMRNEDVTDLYQRVKIGTKVVVI